MPNPLWIMSIVLNFVLVLVLLATKSLRRFPLFGTYAIFNFVGSIVLYSMILQHLLLTNSYFYMYWVFEGAGVVLGFGVVYEIFGRLLTPYPALRRLALLVFRGSTVALVFMGCVVLYAQSVEEVDRIARAVMAVEEATRIVEVGLLMFLFLFSTAFGLHWRQCVFGMALGLGIFATAELVGITLRNFKGLSFLNYFGVVRSIAFNTSLLIWAGYLLVPEKEAITVESANHGQLEQWNQALTEFIYQ